MSIMTMRCVGNMGRFGNAMFQYAFGVFYTRRWQADYQCPRWIGHDLFGLPMNDITVNLPKLTEGVDQWEQGSPPKDDSAIGHDWEGYCQYHTSYYAQDRAEFQALYKPVPPLAERLKGPTERLRKSGGTIVGVHIRRGDYGYHKESPFYLTPIRWYLALLKHLWPTFDSPRLFVASEDRDLVEDFAQYEPNTTESLGVDLQADPQANYNYLEHDEQVREPWQMDFYPDFYLLSQCDVLIIANSTYSFIAAMLAPRLQSLYRSNLRLASSSNESQCFERIDPWSAYPFQHDRIKDYLHLDGIWNPDNPYWKQ